MMSLTLTALAVFVAVFCLVSSQDAALTLESCPSNVLRGQSAEIVFQLSGTLPSTAGGSLQFYHNGSAPIPDCAVLFGSVPCNETSGFCRCENSSGILSFHYTIPRASPGSHNGNWTSFINDFDPSIKYTSPGCEINVVEWNVNVTVNCTRRNCTWPCESDPNTAFVVVLYILSCAGIVCIVLHVKIHRDPPVKEKRLKILIAVTISAVVASCIFVLVVGIVTMHQCGECIYCEVRILHNATIGSLVFGVPCACVGGGVTAYSIYIIWKQSKRSSGEQGGVPLGDKNAANGGAEGGGGTEKPIPSGRLPPMPPRVTPDPSAAAQEEQMSDERSGSTPPEKKKKKKKKERKDRPLPTPERHVAVEIKEH